MNDTMKLTSTEICHLEQHDIGKLLPAQSDEEYRALVRDISDNGVRNPICLHEGKVLDGWHRVQAWVSLGIKFLEIHFRELPDGTDPVGYVLSENLYRRHLTPSQKAIVAAKAYEEHQNTDTLVSMENALKISRRQLYSGVAVTRQGTPELVDKVVQGDVSINEAIKIAKLPADEQRKVVNISNKKARKAKRLALKFGNAEIPETDRTANLQPSPMSLNPETFVDELLMEAFEEYNQEYFDGALPVHQVIPRQGLTVKGQPENATAYGYCDHNTKVIVVNPQAPNLHDVLLHEMVHAWCVLQNDVPPSKTKEEYDYHTHDKAFRDKLTEIAMPTDTRPLRIGLINQAIKYQLDGAAYDFAKEIGPAINKTRQVIFAKGWVLAVLESRLEEDIDQYIQILKDRIVSTVCPPID